MWRVYNSVMYQLGMFDLKDWLLAFVVVVLLGAFCLKGFGSRANY